MLQRSDNPTLAFDIIITFPHTELPERNHFHREALADRTFATNIDRPEGSLTEPAGGIRCVGHNGIKRGLTFVQDRKVKRTNERSI